MQDAHTLKTMQLATGADCFKSTGCPQPHSPVAAADFEAVRLTKVKRVATLTPIGGVFIAQKG